MDNKDKETKERVKKIQEMYDTKYGGISGDEVMIYILDKLETGANRLNRLTITLIILTIALAILTTLDIIRSFAIGG